MGDDGFKVLDRFSVVNALVNSAVALKDLIQGILVKVVPMVFQEGLELILLLLERDCIGLKRWV